MNVDFFIKRPIFTAVCSFIIVLLGVICIPTLPISQYPELTPPTITVSSIYTGATSEVVESAITTPLEKAINGVEAMKYMQSQSSNNGASSITVTFDLSRDKDIACVDVQNRISQVTGTLPQEVNRTGITVSKQSSSIIGGYAFFSPTNEYDEIFISNYIDNYITDELSRVPGVGSVTIAGERKYSMRLWLDPNKLTARGLTADDVSNAIQEQNIQVPAGQIGQPPINSGQQYQISLKLHSRLSSVEEFNNIVLKTNKDGSLVKIKDIGTVELGSEDYDSLLKYSGKSAVGFMIYQLSDANALQVYNDVEAKMAELRKDFPPGLVSEMAFETTSVVKDSIREVLFTLGLAIVLVILVIFFFLQSWRTTLIPIVTIPVSLIGTFMFIKLFGFSINTLTLFGIVLATGLVVDDAIVVIENIQRSISDKGLSPIKAASAGMKEVTSAVVASTMVLAAVFLPVAAIPGTTGQLYKQFALTIVFSVLISLFNSLTLSPAMAAIVLAEEKEPTGILAIANNFINFIRDRYHSILELVLRLKPFVLALFIVLMGCTYYLLQIVPGGFVPNEDQGYIISNIQCPDGTSLEYTTSVMDKVVAQINKQEEVKGTFAISGYSFNGTNPNQGLIFTTLKDLKERKGKMHAAKTIVDRLNKVTMAMPEAIIVSFEPPAIQGIGNVGGFQFELIDKGGNTLQDLADNANKMIAASRKDPALTSLFTSYSANSPQLIINVDRDKAKRIGVSLTNVFDTVQIFLGSLYVNDFDYLNRVYRVYIQADKSFRDNPEVINQYYVNSDASGSLVPLSSLVTIVKNYVPQTITHFNVYRSAEINGEAAPNYSSGQAVTAMQKLSAEVLPQGYSYDWAGITIDQLASAKSSIVMFILGLIFVYLLLAAQYENLMDPLIIIFAVPLAVFGALSFQLMRHLENDIFCQIGLVMLIGLACKNSILIVEFANQLIKKGMKPHDAVLESARIRFRPILMTSLAFILGVLPLALATGAGAASRTSMGTAVFGGMIVSTFLSLFIVPVMFVVFKYIEDVIFEFIFRGKKKDAQKELDSSD